MRLIEYDIYPVGPLPGSKSSHPPLMIVTIPTVADKCGRRVRRRGFRLDRSAVDNSTALHRAPHQLSLASRIRELSVASVVQVAKNPSMGAVAQQ